MGLEEEISEWQKLPGPLQHQFYDHAIREAERRIEFLRRLREKLEGLKNELVFEHVEQGDWEGLRVGVVDGSCPPAPDVRLGGTYALFCSSYKIFEGEELVDEGYRSGMLFVTNITPSTTAKGVLRLLMTRLERKSALDALERGAEWLIIDGSFFGFRYRCRRVEDVEVTWYEVGEGGEVEEHTATGEDIIEELFRATREILKKKSVAIIKRARTRALDGHLVEEKWDLIEESGGRLLGAVMTSLIDKAILSIIMPEGRYFLYDSLFNRPGEFHFYSVLAGLCERWIEDRLENGEPLDFSELYALSEERVRHREKRENIPPRLFATYYPILMEKVRRGFFKASQEAPSCCFEMHVDRPLEEILPYLMGFNNEDTGHPFPLDLVDEDVRLPRRFTREFVEEVEAQVLRKADVELTRDYFQFLNPQKKWLY